MVDFASAFFSKFVHNVSTLGGQRHHWTILLRLGRSRNIATASRRYLFHPCSCVCRYHVFQRLPVYPWQVWVHSWISTLSVSFEQVNTVSRGGGWSSSGSVLQWLHAMYTGNFSFLVSYFYESALVGENHVLQKFVLVQYFCYMWWRGNVLKQGNLREGIWVFKWVSSNQVATVDVYVYSWCV